MPSSLVSIIPSPPKASGSLWHDTGGSAPTTRGYIGYILNWLVVLSLLKKNSQWEGLSHILWKIKKIWNHQPVNHIWNIHTYPGHIPQKEHLPCRVPTEHSSWCHGDHGAPPATSRLVHSVSWRSPGIRQNVIVLGKLPFHPVICHSETSTQQPFASENHQSLLIINHQSSTITATI